MRAKAIMVLGTMSDSGKSAIAAALCRHALRMGMRVAPFKAQNMSLNSHVTPEGGEIGRAQAMQCRAAGTESHTDMNPVLLKPTGEGLMQVIVEGKAGGNFRAREYYSRKADLRRIAQAAYDRLSERFEIIILEGAGSPAEINLREEDFVNASMAEHAGARCVLVADIDRGGVFASILGTVQLLAPRHRALLAGIIINKFRGDVSLLDPGIKEIESLTGIPVLGVLPFLEDLQLEEEDSLGLRGTEGGLQAVLDIAVVRFPYISNFTDFHPFTRIAGVALRFVSKPERMGNPDLIILPGSKNTRHDMEFLRRSGLEKVLISAAARSIPIMGICGGYQMLGKTIRDPQGVEGAPGATAGLGLLDIETILETHKELARVKALNRAFPFLAAGQECDGYEIHMGRTITLSPHLPALELIRKNGQACSEPSGSVSANGLVFGGYLHGCFDNPRTRHGLLAWLSARKGLDWSAQEGDGNKRDDQVFDRLAEALAAHIDLRPLF
ncbi:MAG: cobyric acid synthase [Fibrobacteria bacterium]